MTRLTLTNEFHGTTATLRARDVYPPNQIKGPPEYRLVSGRSWRRAVQKLCPFSGCRCGSLKINGRTQRFEWVTINGKPDHVRL
jgi:hypothetical protein